MKLYKKLRISSSATVEHETVTNFHLENSALALIGSIENWLNRRRKSIASINPNALPVPLDDPITAYAKNAQLIQQQTEGTRNILGGGIPLSLPADTLEVAVGKQAHAIAHASQTAVTTGINENFPINYPMTIPFASQFNPWTASAWTAAPWTSTHSANAFGIPYQRDLISTGIW